MYTSIRNVLLALFVLVQLAACAADDHDHAHDEHDHGAEVHDDHDGHEDHDPEDHDEHDEQGAVSLTGAQMQLAGIEVAAVQPERISYEVYAPGEIRANGYTSYIVSPRTDSVVLRRHVALGEHVTNGQLLVTLFSEAVTEAQAAWQLAAAEWDRVNRLGRQAVGDKRFVEARTRYEGAQGRLIAFGMPDDAIRASRNSSPDELGTYSLVAATDGVVLSDSFAQGQRVVAGDTLMELADESELWVEARLSPGSDIRLPTGSTARIDVDGQQYPAVVAQEAHTIDPVTRTRIVRLVVDNRMHRLHPGMFADVYFEFTVDEAVLAVPEGALIHSPDGHWQVFVETEPGVFSAAEVELGRSLGRLQEITGVAAGTRVVTRSAFFVASQAARGGFDPHNH